jgi:hypothetical protein
MATPQRKPLQLLNNRVAPEPPPSPETIPVPQRPAPVGSRQANREGKRAVTVYVSQEVWTELRVLAARKSSPGARVTTQDLMEEAINLLFQAHSVPHPAAS